MLDELLSLSINRAALMQTHWIRNTVVIVVNNIKIGYRLMVHDIKPARAAKRRENENTMNETDVYN